MMMLLFCSYDEQAIPDVLLFLLLIITLASHSWSFFFEPFLHCIKSHSAAFLTNKNNCSKVTKILLSFPFTQKVVVVEKCCLEASLHP
jgi:hypothetical protein